MAIRSEEQRDLCIDELLTRVKNLETELANFKGISSAAPPNANVKVNPEPTGPMPLPTGPAQGHMYIKEEKPLPRPVVQKPSAMFDAGCKSEPSPKSDLGSGTDQVAKDVKFSPAKENQVPPASKPGARAAQPSKVDNSLENIIGTRWIGRVGVLAILFGVAFFLKYSFDNKLIGETGRVILGLMWGIAFIGMGEYFQKRKNMSLYGQMLSGGGLAILYLSLYAAFAFYNLIPASLAAAGMLAVTTTGMTLAIRYMTYSLAAIALLGGFLTPLMLSTGQNQVFTLFSYILLLDIGAVIVAGICRWPSLVMVSLAGTILHYLGWHYAFYSDAQRWIDFGIKGLFFVLYNIYIVLAYRYSEEEKAHVDQMIILAYAAFFVLGAVTLFHMLSSRQDHFMSLFSYILLLDIGAVVIAGMRRRWSTLVVASLAGTVILYIGWHNVFYTELYRWTTFGFIMLIVVFYTTYILVNRLHAQEQETNVEQMVFFTYAAFYVLGFFSFSNMFSSAEDQSLSLLFYLFLLAIGALVVAWVQCRPILVLSSLLATMILYNWNGRSYTDPFWNISLGFLAIIYVFFNAYIFIARWYAKAEESNIDQAIIFCSAAFIFLGVFSLYQWEMVWPVKIFTLLLAVIEISLAGLVKIIDNRARLTLLSHAAASVILTVVATFIILEQRWIMPALAAEMAVLGWMGLRFNIPLMRGGAYLLGLVVFVRFFEDVSYHLEPFDMFIPLFNGRFLVCAMAIAGFYILLKYLCRYRDRFDPDLPEQYLPAMVFAVTQLLSLMLLSVEVHDYFRFRSPDHQLGWGDLHHAYQMSLSVLWALYASLLTAVGIVMRVRGARILGILLLGMTILKVFLFDLSELQTIYRIISFIVLGLLLLAVSYGYNRFKNFIFGEDQP